MLNNASFMPVTDPECAAPNSTHQDRTGLSGEDWHLAIRNHTKEIEQDPFFTQAYIFRGNVYRDMGDYENAILDYSEMINLHPQSAKAYLNRSIAYRAIGKVDEAKADAEMSFRLLPHADSVHVQ